MSDLSDALRRLRGTAAKHRRSAQWLPPLSPQDIAELQAHLPSPLPPDVRTVLESTGGVRNIDAGPVDSIGLAEGGLWFELTDVFPFGHAIAGDGCGNYWVVDLTPESERWGPVFFASHDPPDICFVATDVTEFFNLVADAMMTRDPETGFELLQPAPVDGGFSNDIIRVHDSGLVTRDDPVDPQRFTLDLRTARRGDGFALYTMSTSVDVSRVGSERIFELAPVPTRWGRFVRWLQRLWGRPRSF